MSTPILPFAVWAPGTNQNSIPANDNALRMEATGRLVISDSTTAQPSSPSDGDVYIIPGSATGTQWATFSEGDIAIFRGGTWYAFEPVEGMVVNVSGTLKEWAGSGGWVTVSGSGSGDVTGPSSSVADRIATYSDTTGKLIKDGGKTIADLAAPKITSTVTSNTITPDGDTDLVRPSSTLSAGLTIANPSGTPADGWGMVLELKDNGTTRSLTWGSKFASRCATLPTATTAGKQHVVGVSYNATDDKLYCDYALVQP